MMSALRITAIFLTILVLHNNYVSGRPDGQLSTDEVENVTETVTEESVTGDEGLGRRKRMVAEEEDPEEDGDEDEYTEEIVWENYEDDSEETDDKIEEVLLERKKRETNEEVSEEEDSDEEETEEGSAEDYFEDEDEGKDGVLHRVFDLAFDDVPTSADGLMEEYYLVL